MGDFMDALELENYEDVTSDKKAYLKKSKKNDSSEEDKMDVLEDYDMAYFQEHSDDHYSSEDSKEHPDDKSSSEEGNLRRGGSWEDEEKAWKETKAAPMKESSSDEDSN